MTQRLAEQIGDCAVQQVLLRQVDADDAQSIDIDAQQCASFAFAAVP